MLRWYGHTGRTLAVQPKPRKEVDGPRRPERPKIVWGKFMEHDYHGSSRQSIPRIKEYLEIRRSGVRSALLAASQLPEGGPLTWMMH